MKKIILIMLISLFISANYYAMDLHEKQETNFRTGSLQGTITDIENSDPIEGAFVNVGNFSGYSNTDGFFSIANITEGSYTLYCQADGYENYVHEESVLVENGQTTTVNFSMIPDGISGEIILSESFENALFPPTGWTETIVEYNYGTAPDWYRFEGTDLSTYNPGYGSPAQDGIYTAVFNSSPSIWSARLEASVLDLSSFTGAELSYYMFHDPMDSWGEWETVQVQVSVDGGNWENLGDPNIRQSMSTTDFYWEEAVLSLTDYIGLSNVRIGFLAQGDDGENMHIDNVVIYESIDTFSPEITDIRGLSVVTTSDMRIKLYVRDHNNIQNYFNAIYSFDNFSTSESFQFNFFEELEEDDLYRYFFLEGSIPQFDEPLDGQIKIELVDEFGNGTGIWSDEIDINWYSPLASISESFEDQEDFSFSIDNWNNFDLDGSATWAVGASYPGFADPGAFQVFNPYATEPPLGPGYAPNSGDKGAVCFQVTYGVNDDWLISKAVIPDQDLQLSLWAKEIYCAYDEFSSFEIAVSTTDLYPESFTVISNVITTSYDWLNYTFDLSGYEAYDYIYAAIHCNSGGFFSTGLYVDDISINSGFVDTEAPELEEIKGSKIAVNSDMGIWVYLKDQSEIATNFTGRYSFDNFASFEDISFSFKETLETGFYNYYIYDGIVPAQASSEEGQIKFELVDEFGNGAGIWTDPLPIEWYSPYDSFNDGFEDYEDFSIEFGRWTNIDLDRATTWGPSTGSYPNMSEPKSFMIFNPSAADPPMMEQWHQPHTGNKTALCSKSTDTNNDWMISPAINTASDLTLQFWARTIDSSWDLEEFRVCVSTTGVFPDNFETVINDYYVPGEDYIEAGAVWTEYTFDLSDYADYEYIYVGFQCISQYITLNGLFIDDFNIWGTTDVDDDLVLKPALFQNYPNPFNPTTTISFSVAQTSPFVNLEIFNIKGQKVRSLINQNMEAGRHSIVWNGTNDNNQSVSSGIYFYKLRSGKFISTQKMILLK